MTVNEELLADYGAGRGPVLRVYEPREVSVVLGAGGSETADVYLDAAAVDRVPVLRRKGGGGTVVLSPGQVVLALVTEVGSPFRNREYACAVAEWIIAALRGLGVADVAHRGISDLAIRDRKILGSSVYRSKLLFFYQASLLVSPDLRLFSRYLRSPSRAPEYRRGRTHEEFCTSLSAEGYPLAPADVAGALEAAVSRQLPGLR